MSETELALSQLRHGQGAAESPGQAGGEASRKLALNRVTAAQKQLQAAEEVGQILQVRPFLVQCPSDHDTQEKIISSCLRFISGLRGGPNIKIHVAAFPDILRTMIPRIPDVI